MVETNIGGVLAQIDQRRSRISWRDRHIDFIELIEDALGIFPEGSEQLSQRQGSILQAIENLKAHAEVLEIELSEQDKLVTRTSIDAVLDALGYPTLDLLPAELQIRIKFSLDRLGLNPAQIFPDQNRLYDL